MANGPPARARRWRSSSEQGVPIVADDLLAIDAGDVLAGPHCVDLRPDVARQRFSDAEPLGKVGNRERYRLEATPAPARNRLRGIFSVEWSSDDTMAIEELSTAGAHCTPLRAAILEPVRSARP